MCSLMLMEIAFSCICGSVQLGNEPFGLKSLDLLPFWFCWTHYFFFFLKKSESISYSGNCADMTFILKSIWHVVNFSLNLIRGETHFHAVRFRLRILLQASLEFSVSKYYFSLTMEKKKKHAFERYPESLDFCDKLDLHHLSVAIMGFSA